MSTVQEQPQLQTTQPQRGGMGKLIILGVAGVVLLIFIFQNSVDVEFSFLFWQFTWPAWGMLLVTLVVGFLAGLLTATVLRRRRRRERRARYG